ncbi:ERBB receptor feedback inhibitor 1a [Gadus chalcogrammus]|uniref:ERBB receptor feedback inhibitor 1a n=1 Tax=Gadus chalcogrammus TaxID=1042646 RepID=UPI0024C4C887|nr:ERBB receptor feedback inhibitor 1a [Gadus chalcogrammus]
MRPDFVWSMSTAGLTAQEICLPTESPFLRASYCHSMARSKPSWSNPHEREKLLYFSMESQHIDPSFPSYQPLPPTLSVEKKKHSQKKSPPALPFLTLSPEPWTPSPDDDQVVPSFQRLSIHERSSPPQTPGRCSKPLPPLPTRPDHCPEQDMDREVEELFLGTEDSRCLVPDLCSKPSPFRYGAPFRRSFRDCGKINQAYFEGPTVQPRPPQPHPLPGRESNRESVEKHPPEPPEPPSAGGRDRALRKLRRSQSGPAGSKPSLLRSSCRSRRPPAMDRATAPPPVPPRPSKTVDYRRWSAGDPHGAYSDEDKPPKLPPREPLPVGCSRTPSPKSLPTYFNGVMPPTQSFAPDPKYVSLQRQNSEGSPCILPVIENGRQASSTHYFLMPLGRGGRGDST